jgi:septal ring factor EnvC (AmiA/AmiB activator)
MNIYLKQLNCHKQSIELTLKQIDNDIAHSEKNIELLKEQKEAQAAQLAATIEAIKEQENNA